MSSRWIIAVVVLLAAAITVLVGRNLYPPAPEHIDLSPPTPSASPVPEPFEPPDPEPDDSEPPPLLKIAVCHCRTPYGACVDMLMMPQAARLHAVHHDHDLIGRDCASASEEEQALRRVLFRPERIEWNSTETLSMADRAAYRERALCRHRGVGVAGCDGGLTGSLPGRNRADPELMKRSLSQRPSRSTRSAERSS